ncbi:S8 family peptidase [Rhizorhapis sp. SPR117]|uniref:S8 family peptidase n=1 Tax=Rhizorhapis sp. SPR117 TaxID=2912611 RepID=UPI001F186362|nr:S8 family serine peptidase [Rhizorhapis sp. SPR117]
MATNFNTAEYDNSNGAKFHDAITAWEAGASGATILVGVVDTGIDIASPEFSGRISSASIALGGNSSYQDEDGHGTGVTGILAAARNDREIMGVAFDANILALRADTAGSCADVDGCTFADNDIAAALDRARTNGAKVVNLSLGGSPANSTLRAAIDRATNAGVIIVISAGNDGTAGPDPLATIATDPVARGLVIIAGSVNEKSVISSFSNRASGAENVYLAALGEKVRSLDLENDPASHYVYSGTSFSAPQIAGAAALLAQAFPNLTSAQIVQLLLSSATDAGATGTDSVYGQGILNIAAAFAPQGPTSLAGSSTVISFTDNGAMSAPMGDAASSANLSTIVLDSYGRAYGMNLAATLQADNPPLSLAPQLQANRRSFAITQGATRISLSIARSSDGMASVTPLLLSGEEARQARARAGYIATKLGPHTGFAIGFAQSAGTLAAMVRGKNEPAFLIASGPTTTQGFRSSPDNSIALHWNLGAFALTASAETGNALVRREQIEPPWDQYRQQPYSTFSIGIDRQLGPLALAFTANHLSENKSVLGARFSPLLGAGSSRSLFVDTDLRLDAGGGWGLGMAWRQGWTWASSGGALANDALLKSNSFAFDLWRTGLFDSRDHIALRVSQPLRISSGGLGLFLPSGYDYGTQETVYSVQRLNLAPAGRQIDVETAYSCALPFGDITANIYYRKDNGNIASYPDDIGAAVRLRTVF